MQIMLDQDRIILSFTYSPRVVAFVKSLTGRKYDPISRTWSVHMDIAIERLDDLIQQGFPIPDELYVKARKINRLKSQLNALSSAKDASFETALPLLPYQKAGAKFLQTAGSAILGDDVGLGKTLQTLAVIESDPEARKVLILCPAILKYQWENEIKKFMGEGVITQVIAGTPGERKDLWGSPYAKYFIANYELLLRDFGFMLNINWDYVVADECNRISSPSSKTAKLIKKLKAKHRFALTGTLISNHAEEVWSIMDWIAPGAFGRFWDFVQRYCYKNNWGGISGYQHLEELNQRLQRYMIRRTKEEVLLELPPKFISDVPVALSPTEKSLYDKIRKELLFEIQPALLSKVENPVQMQNTLVKMIRLRQLADSMELLGEGKGSSKLDALKELLQQLDGRKIIIFTEFAKMADILERELFLIGKTRTFKITGDIPNDERQKILEAYNDPLLDGGVLIMTSAGKFGLNIQAASVVIHYDQPWSLASVVQREGRAHRMGQTKNVLIYNLLAKGTMDMYIRQILRKKQELSDRILIDDLKEMLEYE